MIRYITGDILESEALALVNTVNTVGVMGKGIALQFKKAFPYNFKKYQEACRRHELHTGEMLVTRDSNLTIGEKIIINFPTKTDWRKSSEYEYIIDGLNALRDTISHYRIPSIAIPPLGAGNGGLEWSKVKQLIHDHLHDLPIDIYVYEPSRHISDHMKAERVKLTDARALLLFCLYDSVRNGAFVSEFSSEKICYFMQRLGAEKYLKLEYTPQFYGPYSGKVRYLLSALNGSYLMGYSDMNKKPFEPLTLISDGFNTVMEYMQQRPELMKIATATTGLLQGFYSDFSLELLSSVDYITHITHRFDCGSVISGLKQWSSRKSALFNHPSYIELSLQRLKEFFPQ